MSNINVAYRPLYTSNKRYFLITGGRGSLKSTTVHNFVARLTYEKGHGVLFTRYTMTSAEKSIIPEFKVALERMGITDDFEITKNSVTNKKTGSFIWFAGIKTSSGDQTGSLKSIPGITTWIIEEGEDYNDEKSFDTIDDSIRDKDKHNRIIWIQNPTTKEHFIYKRFIQPDSKKINVEGFNVTVSNMDDVEHIHTTYRIAEEQNLLAKSWLKKAHDSLEKSKQSADKHKTHYYYNYIGGWLEKAEGVILEDWREGEFNDTLPYIHAMDFGYDPDPTTLVKLAIDKKRMLIYVQEKLCRTELSTKGIELQIKLHTKQPSDLVVADNAEKRLIIELHSKHINIQKCIKNEIKKDIKDIQSYTIIVCGKSTNLKIELNNYVWNDKKAGIPVDKFNHLIDAIRYGFVRLNSPKRKFV